MIIIIIKKKSKGETYIFNTQKNSNSKNRTKKQIIIDKS